MVRTNYNADREARIESYRDHQKIKEKMIAYDNEMAQKKEKAIEKYNKNLSIKLEQMHKEADRLELQNALFKKLNFLG